LRGRHLFPHISGESGDRHFFPPKVMSAIPVLTPALPKSYSATSLESPASPSTGRLSTWVSSPPLSLAGLAPHSLRKWVSVHSFATLTHESSPSGRGYTVSSQSASHLSLKDQEMQKPLVRGGELPLPSGTHTRVSVISSSSVPFA
jgi:hypothetical protein